MTKTTALALIASLSMSLAACDDTPDCPAPTAEPAKTAAAVASATPTSPAAKTEPAAAKTEAKPAKTTPPAPVQDPVDDVDVDADLYVKRLVIAHDVKDREPVKPSTTFAQGQAKRIYAFVEVGNRDLSASEVYVSFKPKGGTERGRVRLRVGASPRWRTWAYTTQATEVGEWEAIVRNARDEIIGQMTFHISDDPYIDA